MLENRTDNSLTEHYAAALDWWRDAGVDYLFEDDPQQLLGDQIAAPPPNLVEQSPGAEPEVTAHVPTITEGDLPDTLEGFCDWWMDPASPLPATPAPRIAPRGDMGASIMMLVPMPERDDSDQLLSGALGRLLANIAKALGHDSTTTYIASAIPGHMPLPDWDALTKDGLGTALRHHISLAKPDRVILFGSKLPALLGHDAAAPPESFTETAGIPTLSTFAPERLLDHPRQRARLWRRLLEWTA